MAGPKWATHDPPKSSNGFYTDFAADLPLLKGQHLCKHTGAHLEAQQSYDPKTGFVTETCMVLDPDPAAGRRSYTAMLWHDVHKLVREWTAFKEEQAKSKAEFHEALTRVMGRVAAKGSPANQHVIPTPVAKTDEEDPA